MKTITTLIIAQMAIISFLLFKMYSLETQLEQINVNSRVTNTSQADNEHLAYEENNYANNEPAPSSNKPLSINQIRKVIQEELTSISTALPNKKLKANAYRAPATIDQLEAISSQLDYYFTDGDFSATEMNSFELELSKLNSDDRQKLLNKMAQAMSKANIKFTH